MSFFKKFLLSVARIFQRVSMQDKANFARHLAIIIKAGLPVVEGLKIIRRQTTSRTMLKIIDHMMNDVNSGKLLADSLKIYQHIFGDFFISILKVGEASGTLGENLLYLSEELKKAEGFRGKIRSAMIYPAILLFMTLAVSAFLTFFIFPKLITAFANLNAKLPATTQALIAIINFFQNYGVWIGIGCVVLIIALKFLSQFEVFRYLLHRSMLSIPALRTLAINVNMASFTRVLRILLKSGIRIVESVTITSTTLDNLVYRRMLQETAEGVRRGEELGNLLAQHKKFFPPMLTGMIEIGENTGNLEENLSYLSEYYSEEVETSLKNFTALVEPLILVVMGLIVGFVAIAIVTPIYSLSQGLSR